MGDRNLSLVWLCTKPAGRVPAVKGLRPMTGYLRKLGSAFLDAAFPDTCPGCGKDASSDMPFCPACLEKTGCVGLAHGPLPEAGPGALGAVASLAWYEDPLGMVLRDFKYRRHYAKGKKLGILVRELAGPELIGNAQVIAPVPLHRFRLIRRGFNQACVLFKPLAGKRGLGFEPDVLVRTRRTRPQARLDKKARRENVAGAFAVNPAKAARIAGRKVLLVDDVFTTGATLAECAGALMDAGAEEVKALVLARPALGRDTIHE